MQFAICDWAPALSDEAIESLQTEGVEALEPGPAFLLERDEATLREAAARLRERGIRVYSCHAPFGGDNDLSLLQEDRRDHAIAEHVRCIARAAMAGAECLVIHPSGAIQPQEQEQRRMHLYDSLRTLVKKAEEFDVRLALENMFRGHLGCDAASVRRLVDDLDSPYLGVCFDTGHAHLNKEGVLAAFSVLRERIITFHLQDNDGRYDKHLQPPYGTIRWEEFTGKLRAMEFTSPISIEAPPWNDQSWGILLRELRALVAGQLLTTGVGNRRVRVMCRDCGRYLFGTPEACLCGCDGPDKWREREQTDGRGQGHAVDPAD